MDTDTLPPRQRLLAYTLIALVVLIGLLGMRLLRPEHQVREAPDSRPFVEAERYRVSDEAITIRGFGTVRGEFEATLATEVSGRVIHLHPQLREGGHVPRGALLVEVDSRPYLARQAELEAERTAREAELRQLERQLQRLQELAQRQFVAADALDELRARTDMAKAALQRASAALLGIELDLERTAIHAPFAAVVQAPSVAPGDVLQPGQALARLTSLEHLEVEVALRGNEARLLEASDEPIRAAIVDQRGQRYPAQLVRLSGAVDRQTRTVTAVLQLLRADDEAPGPPRIGEFVASELQAPANGRHYRIPRAALREADAIWTIDDEGQVRRTPITVLLLSGDAAYVEASELGESGLVMTRHPLVLAEGMAVRVRTRDRAEP